MNYKIALFAAALLTVPAAQAEKAVFHDYARVVDVDPIVRWREVPVEKEICRSRHGHGPAVLGGSVTTENGGKIGAYAVLPASSGNRHGYERCRTVTEYVRERYVDGYRVTYRYHGHRFTTHTEQHPGKRVAVKVKLRPMF